MFDLLLCFKLLHKQIMWRVFNVNVIGMWQSASVLVSHIDVRLLFRFLVFFSFTRWWINTICYCCCLYLQIDSFYGLKLFFYSISSTLAFNDLFDICWWFACLFVCRSATFVYFSHFFKHFCNIEIVHSTPGECIRLGSFNLKQMMFSDSMSH